MLLTIVTVNFNNFGGLIRTMESVACQPNMGDDVEHLIVDGGSTDGSAEILEAYTDQHPWAQGWSRPDDGIYDAMNKAIESARGRYVYFLNSGDELYDDRVIDGLRRYLGKSKKAWAVGNIVHRNGGARESVVNGVPFSRFRFLTARQQYNHQGVICDRSILAAIGGFGTNPPYYADAAVMLKFASLCSPLEIPMLLATYEGGGYSSDKVASMPLNFHRLRTERDDYPRLLQLLSLAWAIGQVVRRQGIRKGLGVVRASVDLGAKHRDD